ncbi:hypothetical protein ACFPIF_18210 [Brevundimonas faecalis]|uniref:hypothetical protein n=1 Tax=Brevundimonas faecalis TaxID=947378 RepID=UPI0036138FF1
MRLASFIAGDGRGRLAGATLILSIALGGSSLAGEADRLSTSEIAALLKGVVVRLDEHRSGVRTSNRGEVFLEGGAYIRLEDRAPSAGRFEIRNDQVCVRLNGRTEERCLFVFASDGQFYFSDTGGAGLSERWPVVIDPYVP